MAEAEPKPDFYCPTCAKPVDHPLVCGDCHAIIRPLQRRSAVAADDGVAVGGLTDSP